MKTPVTALLLGCFMLWTTPARALTAYWNFDGTGNWSNSGNWLGGTVPNGVGDIADFNFNISANRAITLDVPITLGGLRLGDTLGAQAYTFGGPAVLTLDALGSAHAFINKYNSTTDVWQAPLQLNDDLDANIFAGILDVTGAGNTQVAISSSASDIIKNGGGTLRLNLDATGYNGDWVLNQGTLAIGGANAATAGNLGNGTGGILLNGTGLAATAVLSLNNNGTGSNGTITYTGNNDVVLQGAATINVDRNFISGANSGNTIVLDNLTMNGGILAVTSANSYALRFNGTTTLAGDTNVFSVGNNSTVNLPNLTLGGVIDDGAGSRALIKEGTGRMVIANSANTYDGVTAVKDGFLQIASGANLGTGKVFVNGGALSLSNAAQTGVATMPGGLNIVSQIGTSRAIMGVIGNTGFTIDSGSPLNLTVPIYGMVLGVDGSFANNIDISQVGGTGNTRVSVANIGGVDRTYTGTLSPATDNTIRLNSAANTFIISGTNALGGPTSNANLSVGLSYANPLIFSGVNITQGNTGTVSVRGNNSATLGPVTVNRGVTLAIEGAGLTTPLGNGVVTSLGGTISTDATTDAKFGNTDFRIYGGGTLFIDNSAVTTANADRRLATTTNIDLTSSTLRLRGDGGAATVSSQAVNSIDYWGGSTLSVDTDGTTAGRLTTLTTASLNRQGTATLNIRNIANTATTFGTAAGTQKLIVTANPTVTNGMIGANIALWAGANANDGGDTRFATYDATHGIQAATMITATTAANLQSATNTQIIDFNNVAGTITLTGNATMQALRLRTTANTQVLNSGAFTITLGSAAAVGQGAGLQLIHTAGNEVIHATNFAFGAQEGMIYTATPTGGGIVTVSGVLSGTNGITRFGDGILRLNGANTFTGPLTINAGETRLNNVRAAGPIFGTPNEINLWGGLLFFEAANQRYNNNVTFFNDARLGNVNVASTGFNNLTVAARTGSTAPIVLDLRHNGGNNTTVAYGGLTLNGPAQAYVSSLFQINGAISGSGALEKFGNERLIIGGDSSTYIQPITVNTGVLSSIIATSSAKPFGSGAITLNPGGSIRLAAPTNINASQVTMNSDLGGIAAVGMSYVANPMSLPAMTISSSAPWKGTLGISAVGFNQNISQSTLWGGGAYLGSLLGDTGTYTGTLTPDGTTYRLGTGQGTIRIASPLTGAGNSVLIGLSMSGDVGRADQAVNNAGGTVQYDMPMTYGGATVIHTSAALRVSAATATTGIGALTLNGGILQGDSNVSNFRGIAPLSISNAINLAADSTIQMQNQAGDFRLTGPVNLAPGSTGVVRQLTVGIDGTNAGMLYLDGGISDGPGGSGNHLIKSGQGIAFLTAPVSYTGTTTITQGFLAVNSDADLASSSQIVLGGGGLAVLENSFTLNRNVSIQTTANNLLGWFDVKAGLTLTQGAGSTIDGPQNGAFTNSGMLAKRGLGTMILNGTNSMTGVLALDGVLQVNNQAALGDPARVGASDIQIGGDFFIGGTTTVTRFTGGTLRINDNVVTTRGIQFNNNGSSVYGGGIDVTAGNNFTVTGVMSQGSEFDFWFKTGAGTLVATGANTFRQAAFTNGAYQFSTSTPWTNSTATAADNTILEWIGGTVRAVNAGANITLTNQASTTTYNYGGGMTLQMESGAARSIEFAADNLIRQNQGTVVLQTIGATTLGGVGNVDTGRLLVTNAINAGLARGSAMTNGIFAPHILAADSTGVASFATDDAITGFKPYAGATLSSLAGANPTSIGDISGVQTLSGANSIYAFRTTADINGGTLRIRAIDNVNMGGIVFNGSNTVSSNLIFDPTSATAPGTGIPGEGLVYVKSGESATINGTTLANALTKFGNGTLTLAGNGAVLGDVSVQSGTLKLGATNPFSRMNSELNLNAGATLDLNGSSIAIETLGSNNRQVTGTGGGVNFGGSITNAAGGSAATLSMASGVSSTFTGTINGNLKLMKAGTGVLTIDGYRASTPDSGSNTFTGGTNVYGVNTTGGLLIDNAPFAFGGANGSTPGDVNLYSGIIDFRYTGNATTFGIAGGTNGQQYNNLTVRYGADGTDGVTLNVRGPGLINVDRGTGGIGQGNIMQVGALNLANTTLAISGANLYRFRAAGPTTIQGAQATLQTNSTGPAGIIELTGLISGSGSLNKLGDTVLGAVVIAGNANTYSGGTNIIAGEVQVTATSGTPLGSGPVRVFPTGTLRLAGNGSVDGSKLQVFSSPTALGAISLDANFDPTVLTSANFGSVYNSTLQLSQPYFTQPLNLASIGDGRTFLGTGLGQEVKYMAAMLGAGAPDAWNPGVGVYRVVGGSNNLAFDGADNVFTGNTFLQVGPQRGNAVAAPTNGGNSVLIRNSNNWTGGTQITEGAQLVIETGGSPLGDTPLGSGAVEVYGTLLVQGNLGSTFNANTGTNANTINLRPGGQVRIIDSTNLVAGNQGRWGDTVPVDLNGGTFRYDGAANYQSVETIGDVAARKGGTLTVIRNSTASSAQLNIGNLNRIAGGTVTLNYSTGFLGINNTTPLSYERITVAGGVAVSGTTSNGAGVTNPGIVAPWIVDRVNHTFLGYNPTGAATGFQPLVNSLTPGAGELGFSNINDTAGANITLPSLAGGTAVFSTANTSANTNPVLTLGNDLDVYALRLGTTAMTSGTNQPAGGWRTTIERSGVNDTVTIRSGGLIFNNATPTADTVTSNILVNPDLVFGTVGLPVEALIYASNANANTNRIQSNVINGQVTAAGITKFGPGTLEVRSINPNVTGVVTVNEGTIVARVPFSGSGAPVGGVFNGQDVILNGGGLQLDPFLANATGTSSVIASDVRATAVFNSNIIVRGDSSLNNNGQANYVRIPNLTFENGGGATAMNGNGVISLNLQNGIWVSGTTTLIPQAMFNMTFNNFAQTTFAGQITENGVSDIEKFGNGTMTFLNGTNNYSGGTIVHGAAGATAASIVASGFRGSGTPFGSGAITVNPGGLVRIGDNANIAGNAVTLKSDGFGLAGLGIAHNGALPTIITSGVPTAGQVKIESTGPFGGVLALDYGYYSQDINLASIGNGDWWLGNSGQAETFYFNDTLGANSNGKYQIGGGGNQSGITFGSVLVSAGRTSLFENVFTGGTPGSVRVEVGALTADLAANGPSFVNGNSGFQVMVSRNTGLVGDTRVNTNTTLALGNNFALGTGRLVMNGGVLRYDFGPNNVITSNITIDNDVLLQGDFTTAQGNELVINGNVAMHESAYSVGATRIWNLTGSGLMAVRGEISGADGSNLIKRGAQIVAFSGVNSYQGYTQIDRGEIVIVGNVAPGVNGPLGNSISPIVLGVESTNNAGSLGIGGKYAVSRDIIVSTAPGSGVNGIAARTNERAVVSGGISVATGAIVTLGAAAVDVVNFRGGLLDVQGPISGAGAVVIGTTGAAPGNGGTVLLSASANGLGTNTFSGGTTLNSGRLQIVTDTYFTGSAGSALVLSGPLGTGALTFGAGESNRGGTIEAVGGARTIVNALGAIATTANTTVTFSGMNALTFTRDLNLNSDGTMRSRTFNVQNATAPVTFSGTLSNSGAGGATLTKTGVGALVLSGANTMANLLTTDASYGSGVVVDAGILRVSADTALGSTLVATGGGQHSASTPADIRLRSATGVLGGTLSVSENVTTARKLILGTTSTGTTNTAIVGIDVAATKTLTLSAATALQTGAVTNGTIIKTGTGTLALDNNANTQTALIIGGQAQTISGAGLFSHTGGTVSTTATSGAPFVAVAGTNTVTINGGTLALVGGAVAQALSVPRIVYGSAAHIALNQGTTASSITASEAAATAFQRSGAVGAVNFGTLVLNTSPVGGLGGSEKVLITNAAAQPANTAGSGGSILTVPSIVTATSGVGMDADFVRYDATIGFMAHNVTTVTDLSATTPGNVANIALGGTTAGSGIIDVLALRTAGSITPTDGTSLVRILGGGLILNGSTAPNISANLSFNSGSGAIEALTYVRDGQSGASILSGNIAARDFTKFGPGALEVSGATNTLDAGITRQPVLSVQEGTFRFASTGAQFSNLSRPASVTNLTGSYVLNVNESGVFDMNGLAITLGGLTGNGTVTSNVAGAANLRVSNGFGADMTFSGGVTNGAGTVGITKTGNGILTLSGHSSNTGGTTIEAGRITNAVGAATANGTLDARRLTALGAGTVSLVGGTLAINNNIAHAEVEDGIEFNTFGPGKGYDVVIQNSGFTNGIALPANTSSTININSSNTAPATGVSNTAINSLTINAPLLTIGGAATAANLGLLFVKGTTTFSQAETVLRIPVGGQLVLGGQVNAGSNTITKIGANNLVLTHTESGASQNTAGLWKVYGGILNPRVADGAANPLGLTPTVEINGGSTNYGLLLSTDGDGTAATERVTTYASTNLRFGSMLPVSSNQFVASGAGRISADRILANNDDKTVVVNNLEVGGVLGSPYVFTTSGNSDSHWVQGTTTFTRDLYLQNDARLTLNGVISGNGTFVKRAGSDLFINADNTSGWKGGTVLGAGGTLYFGSMEGNQLTLSDTAKLGIGQVIINPASRLLINGAGNVQVGQTFSVGGNLNNYGVLGIGSNVALSAIGYRALGVGGIQNGPTNYYTTASNPSGSVLALNTVYSQTLNQRALGDGMGYIGSTTNGNGANGLYDAATLAAGLGNTYRLGGGGSTLFVGLSNANVLSNPDASTTTNLIVGAPMSVENNNVIGNGAGTVVLLGSNNYTGSTRVNRGSTLDFRGTLATSAIDTYGGLNVAGESGTFIGAGTVNLRPGSTLRFDNTSAGVLPVTSTAGRWADGTAIALNNSTLRMQGNAAVETVETVGAISTQGGSFIEVVRGVAGRGTEIRTSGISRVNSGTIQLNHNTNQLGTDERLILGAAPTVTSGMVEPWMVSNTDIQFLTYNADTGFTLAGFDNIQVGGTTAATLNLAANRVLFSTAATVLGTGFNIDTYAARLDQNLTLAVATSPTGAGLNRLIVQSGGLILNGARTVTVGLQAGPTGTNELLLYNNNTVTLGDPLAANRATSGQIAASSITKFGAGQLNLNSEQQTFVGDIRVQQGQLVLRYANGTETNPVSKVAGNGGTIFLEGPNVTLFLRGGQDNLTGNVTFNNSVTIGDYNPIVQLDVDRQGGSISNRRNIIAGNFTFGANNAETGQIVRFVGANTMDFQLGDAATDLLTLVGKSTFQVEASGQDVFVAAQTTGTGQLIKSQAGVLQLENMTTLNDWSGGTTVMNGTVRVFTRANNNTNLGTGRIIAGGTGAGDITLTGGSLDLRVDADTGATTGGTFTRTGTTVTVTQNAHGYTNGQIINVTSGPEPGLFVVGGVATNTFTYTTVGTGTIASTPHASVGPDTNTERIRFAGSGNGPNLTIAGASTLNLDRTGLFTFTNTAAFGSNKQIGFNNLTIGSQIFSVTGANGYGAEISGTTTKLGNMFLNNTTDFVLGGAIIDGGAGTLINKVGTGVLWINSANSTLTGPTYINAGILDWGDRLTANTTATLGSGDIFVNPNGAARVRGLGNINTGAGQQIVLTSTPYSSALLRTVGAFTQADLVSMIQPRTTTSNEVSYVSFEGNLAASNLDQSAVGDGRIYFGAVGDRTYAGAAVGSSLTPGLANLPNAVVGGTSTNRVYRLGNNAGNTLTINLTAAGAGLGDVGGATDVQIGSLASLGQTNYNTGFVYFQDPNTYTGQTVVSRGLTLRFNTGMTASDAAGPLGIGSSGAALIDIYGGLRSENGSSFRKNDGTANYYTNLKLHPGSALSFQDMQVAGNRWDDATGINLDGATLVADASNNLDNGAESVGALTFDRGARINLVTEGTGDAFLTVASVTRAAAGSGAGTGHGTLVIAPTASASLGATAAAASTQLQTIFTAAPTASSAAVVGMLPGYLIDGTGHRFLTHNATTGVVPVADGAMVPFSAGMTAGTAVVNVTANVTLPDFNPTIFALRGGNFTVNSPTGANNEATITLAGSGNDIGSVISTAATFTINPDLKFGTTGTNEALFYAGGTMQINGTITAGSVTKFGTGQMNIGNDQSDAARGTGRGYSNGWVVNEGSINLQTFGSAGNAVPSNTIVLNGNQSSTATLFLRAQPADTLLNYAYTSGEIIAVDNATIDWDPGVDDRVHTIADIEIQQSGGIGNATVNGTVDAQLRIVNVRNRSILAAGQLTVTNNAILNVDTTSTPSTFVGASNVAGNLTNGSSSGMSVASLTGSARLTKWGDGYLYVRGASPSFSGTMVIDQGAVHVTDNGSLGTGELIVNRYGVLDIGVAGFAATNSSVTMNEGSVERWSVDGARTGTIDLGKGSLQVGADQNGTVAVTLNGGTIEAWLRTDDITATSTDTGVFRNLGPNVSVNLAANSMIGNPYFLGTNGLDSGRQTNDYRPTNESIGSGATLNIQGVISGASSLTKVGYDTVILSGANTYTGGTAITGGTVKLGRSGALVATGNVTTTANGVLDLNGYNQTVAQLSNPVNPTTPTTNSGYVTNSAAVMNTLTVGNGVSANFTYSGVIQHNVALTKVDAATMQLDNANTYRGKTTIAGGVIKLGISASIDDSEWVEIQPTGLLDVSAKTSGYSFDGRISGGGTAAAGSTFATATNAARISGAITVGDHFGEVSSIGTMSPGGSSLVTDITTAGNQIGHIYTDSGVTLSGGLVGSSPVQPVTRLTMQLNGSTTTLTSLGYSSGSFESFIDGLTGSEPALNGGAGNLAGHDYLNVGGTLTLNADGRIVVSKLGAYNPSFGDVFNLLDWGTLAPNGFVVGSRYQDGTETGNDLDLPTLADSSWHWDTSKFGTLGVLIVVPEPGRVSFLLLGLMSLLLRRRRSR